MAHHHSHTEISSKNLIITMFLNFSITVAEVIGGLFSGSLSLLSDALHNLSDGFSVIITYVALKLAKRKNTEKMTFGYKRAEILAALFNASVLVVISILLFKEAYLKFINPEPINGGIMIWVALIGLIANTLSVILLSRNAKNNLNIKSTYLHLLSDAISSVGVVVGGVMIYYFKIYWVDPLLTALIGAYVIKESFEILNETLKVLMQATPEEIDIKELENKINKIEEVQNIHHLHIWKLSEHNIHAEFHIKLKKDVKLSEADIIREKIAKLAHNTFNIEHVTIQIEYNQKEPVGLIKNNE